MLELVMNAYYSNFADCPSPYDPRCDLITVDITLQALDRSNVEKSRSTTIVIYVHVKGEQNTTISGHNEKETLVYNINPVKKVYW